MPDANITMIARVISQIEVIVIVGDKCVSWGQTRRDDNIGNMDFTFSYFPISPLQYHFIIYFSTIIHQIYHQSTHINPHPTVKSGRMHHAKVIVRGQKKSELASIGVGNLEEPGSA